MDIWAATQTRFFKEEFVDICLIQNSDLYLDPQTEPGEAKRSAECMIGHFDRMKIHHEDETTSTYVDSYEEIDTESVSETSRPEGAGSKTKTKGTHFRPVHRDRIQKRAVYESPQDQLFWQQQAFQKLPVGSFWVKQKGEVPFLWEVPLVEDSWVFPGLARDKFEACLAQLKQTAAYETPSLVKPEITEEVMALCSKKKQKLPQSQRQNGHPNGKQNGHQPKGAGGRLSGRRANGGNGKLRSSGN